jgi:hypothetical protein
LSPTYVMLCPKDKLVEHGDSLRMRKQAL